jgi:hypothetical protein
MNDMKTYKMRAECLADVLAGLSVVKCHKFAIESEHSMDCIVTFDCTKDTRQIINDLETVEDGHVMAQTVDPIEDYDGERRDQGERIKRAVSKFNSRCQVIEI